MQRMQDVPLFREHGIWRDEAWREQKRLAVATGQRVRDRIERRIALRAWRQTPEGGLFWRDRREIEERQTEIGDASS